MRPSILFCAVLTLTTIACADRITEPSPDIVPSTVAFATTTAEDGLSISTDKDDYAPGDTVIFTGSGWAADDILDVVLIDEPQTHDPHEWSVSVGADGTFQDSTYVVDVGDLGVTFTLTATSRITGRSLTVVFTDGNVTARTNAPDLTISVAWRRFNNTSCAGNPLSTGTVTGVSNSVTIIQNVVNGQSVEITAPATASGRNFVNWTSGNDVRSSAVICVPGATPAQNWIAGYAPPNQPPTAEAGGPYTGNEGAAIPVSGSASSDVDGTIASYQWSIVSFAGAPGGGSCSFVDGISTGVAPSVSCNDNGTLTLSLTVTDNLGANSAADQATVTVSNLPPEITAVSVTPFVDGYIYPITAQPSVNATFTDPGSNDTHSCVFEVFDFANAEVGTDRSCGSGTGVIEAGVYTVKITVTDDDSGSDSESIQVVIYDPSAGFVTGGGWIHSAAGAYKANAALEGKATFGFVSKYQKGATIPTGNTEFVFHAGSFNFHSSNYQWLVVNAVGTRAQYKGQGTVNGSGAFQFILTALDGKTGGPDQFRIQIFQADGETVVYDNYVGGPATEQPLGGGSVVIHTGKK